MALFEDLQGIMVKYRFRPEKKLSQFFCIKQSLLDLMIEKAEITKKDIVLEIGPGTGFLTRSLIETGAKIIAVERDSKMSEIIAEEFKEEIKEGKLTLIEGDFLEQDLEKLKVTKVVALPPYHISTKIVIKLVRSKISRAVLMLDTGFIMKLTAFEGLKEYTALSVLTNLNADIDLIKENISGENFFPTPNCRNTIVQLDFDTQNNSPEFYHFIKQLFRHKNKDLGRGLKQAFPFIEKELHIKKEELETFIENLDLADVKVNLLSPKQLKEVFEELIKA